jgi:hypothetical protein
MKPEDKPFIAATWIKGLRYGNKTMRDLQSEMYYPYYNKLIDKVLNESEVKVSVLVEDPDLILAYAVFQKNVLHYCFCKPVWRRLGIVKRMIPAGVNICSHLTGLGKRLMPQTMRYVQYEKLEKQFQ